jgi:hypothetical protein
MAGELLEACSVALAVFNRVVERGYALGLEQRVARNAEVTVSHGAKDFGST